MPHDPAPTGRTPRVPALPIAFWVLACLVGGMVWRLSDRSGSGGDPAGNAMSTGILELLADALGGLAGLLALAFAVFKGPGVRATATVLLGLLAVLLLVILAH